MTPAWYSFVSLLGTGDLRQHFRCNMYGAELCFAACDRNLIICGCVNSCGEDPTVVVLDGTSLGTSMALWPTVQQAATQLINYNVRVRGIVAS